MKIHFVVSSCFLCIKRFDIYGAKDIFLVETLLYFDNFKVFCNVLVYLVNIYVIFWDFVVLNYNFYSFVLLFYLVFSGFHCLYEGLLAVC